MWVRWVSMNVKNKIGCLRDFMNVGEFGFYYNRLLTYLVKMAI